MAINTKFNALVKGVTTKNEVVRKTLTVDDLLNDGFSGITLIGKEKFKVVLKEDKEHNVKISPRVNYLCQIIIQLAKKQPIIDNFGIRKAQKNGMFILNDIPEGMTAEYKQTAFLEPFTINEIAFAVAYLHLVYKFDISIRNRNDVITLKPFEWNDSQFEISFLSLDHQNAIKAERVEKQLEIANYISSGLTPSDAEKKYRENHKKVTASIDYFGDSGAAAAVLVASTKKENKE